MIQELTIFRILDQLEKTSKKLSCLRAVDNAVLPSELYAHPNKAGLNPSKSFAANVGKMDYFSAREQLPKVTPQSLEDDIHNLKVNRLTGAVSITWRTIISLFNDYWGNGLKSHTVVCVVPLPYFNTFDKADAREAFRTQANITRTTESNLELSSYNRKSMFLQLTLDSKKGPNIWKEGDDVMILILQYKWAAFIRNRFFCIYAVLIVYYITYCVGIQFAVEVFDYNVSNAGVSLAANSHHLACLVIFFISFSILLSLEILQMFNSSIYFQDFYNSFDCLALLFPLLNYVQLVLGINYFVCKLAVNNLRRIPTKFLLIQYESCSVSALILWLHGIIKLRVISSFVSALLLYAKQKTH